MSRHTVLVADDDEMTREVLSTVLDLEGMEVLLAVDGAEAMRMIGEQVPDALVLDHMMPGINGLEVLQKLRADDATAGLPVVVLTAAQAGALPADPVAAGADAHLEKPFSPLHLLEVLESLLGAD